MDEQSLPGAKCLTTDMALIVDALTENFPRIIRLPLNRNKGPCLRKRMLVYRKNKSFTLP